MEVVECWEEVELLRICYQALHQHFNSQGAWEAESGSVLICHLPQLLPQCPWVSPPLTPPKMFWLNILSNLFAILLPFPSCMAVVSTWLLVFPLLTLQQLPLTNVLKITRSVRCMETLGPWGRVDIFRAASEASRKGKQERTARLQPSAAPRLLGYSYYLAYKAHFLKPRVYIVHTKDRSTMLSWCHRRSIMWLNADFFFSPSSLLAFGNIQLHVVVWNAADHSCASWKQSMVDVCSTFSIRIFHAHYGTIDAQFLSLFQPDQQLKAKTCTCNSASSRTLV